MTLGDLIQIAKDEGIAPENIHLMFDPSYSMDMGVAVELSVEEGSSSIRRGFGPNTFVLIEERPILCEGCGENDATDYETGMGHHLCPECVNRGLAIRVADYTLNHLEDFDPELARINNILTEDDGYMRARGMPYVDSVSVGIDVFRGCSIQERHDLIRVVCDLIVRAYSGPGAGS